MRPVVRFLASSAALALLTATPTVLAGPFSSDRDLVLAVQVNELARGDLLAVRLTPDGHLWAAPEKLRKAGIKPGELRPNDAGLIRLADLEGVTHRYDEPAQRIEFEAIAEARMPHVLNAGRRPKPIDWNELQSHPALTLNYSFYGGADFDWETNENSQWLSAAFDSRFSSAYGFFSSGAVVRTDGWDFWDLDKDDRTGTELIRLDSSWEYHDPLRVLTYRAGDVVSSSPSWATSYRLGGVQFSRNFGIRPDLITSAIPDFSGSAVVPSTLDVYLNNTRVYSGDIPSGPFTYSSMPYLSGGGDARIVVRDELGREIVTEIPYFIMPGMLQEGLFDFSIEAGFPRTGFGKDSFEYESSLAVSATGRYAFSRRFTGEAHFKTYDGLYNGGIGLVSSFGRLGGVHVGVSGSHYIDQAGGRIYARYQGARQNFNYYAGTERSFGDYVDIGSLLSRTHDDKIPVSSRARSINRAGISFPLGFDKSRMGIGWTQIEGAGEGDDGHYLNASWSRSITETMSVYANAYGKTDGSDHYGIYAGLTVRLGESLNASTSASADKDGVRLGASIGKTARSEEGAVGWNVRASQHSDGSGYRGASGSYRTAPAQFHASVEQSDSSGGRVTGSVEGSLVAAGGGLFAANRIDDAFAIVNVGAPGVEVTRNGRRIATSNRSGRALITNLESFNTNRIGLDPTNLPLEMQAQGTAAVVLPNYRSGVVVDFGVRKVEAATLTVTLADGTTVPVGSLAARVGTIDNSVAGYDGEIYLTGLKAGNNEVAVTLPGGDSCRVRFTYAADAGAQQKIGPVICH